MAQDGDWIQRHLTFDVTLRHIVLVGETCAPTIEDLQQISSAQSYARFVGASGSYVAISTERDVGRIGLDLELRTLPPLDEDLRPWDSVTEVSIVVGEAGLVLTTPPGDDFYQFPLARGSYRVRVYVSGVSTVNPNRTQGEDQYRVILWPACVQEPAVLHATGSRRW